MRRKTLCGGIAGLVLGGLVFGTSLAHAQASEPYTWQNVQIVDCDDPDCASEPACQACTPTSVSVDSVELVLLDAGRGSKSALTTVSVVDDCGVGVSGATVLGTFSGDITESATGITDGGVATIDSVGTVKGTGSITFCVDDVTTDSLPYTPPPDGDCADY